MRRVTLFFVIYLAVFLISLHTKLPADIFLAMMAIFLCGGAVIGFVEYRDSLTELDRSLKDNTEKKEKAKKKLYSLRGLSLPLSKVFGFSLPFLIK